MRSILVLLVWTSRTLLVVAQDDGDDSGSSPSTALQVQMAHAIIASIAWVIFFPVGAVAMRLIKSSNAIWIHAAIQGFTTLLLIASVATGIILAQQTDSLDSYHPIIGLVLFGLVFLQAAGGILHHLLFRKHQRRTIVSYVHVWTGRILITIGMINGGLGMLLADDSTRGERIAYGVIAGFVWLMYVVISVFTTVKERAPKPNNAMERKSQFREES